MNKLLMLTFVNKIGVLTIALTMALAANFVYGQWTDPTNAPPNDNADVPLNTSGNAQIKSGNLGVDNMFAADTVYSDRYCNLNGEDCFEPTSAGSLSLSQFDNSVLVAMSYRKNTWYTNDSGTTIQVNVGTRETSSVHVRENSNAPSILVGGSNGDSSDGPWEDETFLVPPGWQYRVAADSIRYWTELRPSQSLELIETGHFSSSVWQAMSYQKNTWYTNDTGTTIQVNVGTRETSNVYVREGSSYASILVGGSNGDSSDGPWEDETFLVPPGWQYRVESDSIRYWSELRPR